MNRWLPIVLFAAVSVSSLPLTAVAAGSAAAKAEQAKAEALNAEAKEAFKSGNFDRAAELFMQVYDLAKQPAAVYNAAQAAGEYTVQVSGVGGATGTVIAELYDATASGAFTTTTPRLVNVSVLKQIGAGETLTAGFVVGGATAKQILIRAVGPTLGTAFGIPGVMADPKLDLFSGQTVINANDNWGRWWHARHGICERRGVCAWQREQGCRDPRHADARQLHRAGERRERERRPDARGSLRGAVVARAFQPVSG